MWEIRYADAKDLENMIDLWAEEWNGLFSSPLRPIVYGGSEAPRVSSVLRFAEELHAQIVCRNVLVAEQEKNMLGFVLFEQNYDEQNEKLWMEIYGVWVSRECWPKGGELAEDLIRSVGKVAARLGYYGMHIGLNQWKGEKLRDVCVRLGAEHVRDEGEMQMLIQHFEWTDLTPFQEKKERRRKGNKRT